VPAGIPVKLLNDRLQLRGEGKEGLRKERKRDESGRTERKYIKVCLFNLIGACGQNGCRWGTEKKPMKKGEVGERG